MKLFKQSLILLMVGVYFSGCATSSKGILTSQPSADDPITIVAFGDSITSASRQSSTGKWTSILQAQLREALPDREIIVINSGVGGNTSREGLARMEKDVLAHQPDIVLVEFGGNDATQTPNRHVTLDEFRKNLTTILTTLQTKTSAEVVLLTFPPVIDEWHSWGKDPFFIAYGGGDAYVENYRVATKVFAAQHNLVLVDIDQALRVEMERLGTESMILKDGVHLTNEGNKIVANEVAHGLLNGAK